MLKETGVLDLAGRARLARKTVLDLVYRTRSPHIGSAYSCVELLIALYFHVLDKGDRLIFSKGHACAALYAVLWQRGLLSDEDLAGFAVNAGVLEQHPQRDPAKGIELSTGSLGHGLSVAAGMAFSDKFDRQPRRTFVLLSDGELDEGSNWEAIMFASQHKLDNLIAVVDYNRMQALGFTKDALELEPLADKWKAFGWDVREVPGHDLKGITAGFAALPGTQKKPAVIIAHTVKGKGVSFMENSLLWHYRAPDQKEYRQALEELENA